MTSKQQPSGLLSKNLQVRIRCPNLSSETGVGP